MAVDITAGCPTGLETHHRAGRFRRADLIGGASAQSHQRPEQLRLEAITLVERL